MGSDDIVGVARVVHGAGDIIRKVPYSFRKPGLGKPEGAGGIYVSFNQVSFVGAFDEERGKYDRQKDYDDKADDQRDPFFVVSHCVSSLLRLRYSSGLPCPARFFARLLPR